MEGVIGYTTLFAGNFAPKSWAFCQGQIINIASNTALFSILGTVYGGNGTTTFALPDLRGRRLIGAGQGPGLTNYPLGANGGHESVTLTAAQMPAHAHTLQIVATPQALADGGATDDPANGHYALNGSGYAPTPVSGNSMKPYTVTATLTNTGSDYPFEIIPPYVGLNYIICTYGVFPARN